MPMHGGRLVAKTLKEAGVECLFTLCGGHIMPIYDGCLEEGIRVIDVRHEQSAAHAADAWSRVNPGKIGVAAVTAGPGVTDAVTGVANAWRANSPMLVIGGQGPFSNRGRGSLQEMDHVALMRPITKYADTCLHTERLPETLELAIRHAVSGIPGPAFLEIPMDILMNVPGAEIPIPKVRTAPPEISPDPAAVREALEVLSSVQRAFVMVGTSVKWSNAQEELARFLDRTHLPAFANGMGRGMLPRDSPHLFQRTRRAAFEEAEAIVLAGSVLDFRLGFGASIPKTTKIIQLEMDNTLIGQNRPADIALVGNLRSTFHLLNELLESQRHSIDFSDYARHLREKENAPGKGGGAPSDRPASEKIPTSAFCRAIAEFVDDDMILIGDGGDVVAGAAKVVPVPKNGYWMDPGPLGTLGVGMPFALAAQLAHPDKRVLIIYGDGSFGLNGFEYDTAVRFGLPIVGIVGNDAAWGQIMRPQRAFMGPDRMVATELEYTRYDRVVEALGGHGEHVTRAEEIRPALERAFASGKPACVNVELERDLEFKGGTYI
jgi:acetolactate synthase-1/2/3 large subunit